MQYSDVMGYTLEGMQRGYAVRGMLRTGAPIQKSRAILPDYWLTGECRTVTGLLRPDKVCPHTYA